MAFWAETKPRMALNAISEVFMVIVLLSACKGCLDYLFASLERRELAVLI
jgi:hypothetical protein